MGFPLDTNWVPVETSRDACGFPKNWCHKDNNKALYYLFVAHANIAGIDVYLFIAIKSQHKMVRTMLFMFTWGTKPCIN